MHTHHLPVELSLDQCIKCNIWLCLHCNLPLRPAQKAEVLDRLPPRIAQLYERFCTCDGCGRVFWEGSHWDRMRGWLRHAVPGLPR